MNNLVSILTLVLLLFTVILKLVNRNVNRERFPPQPSGAWPVIGHIPLLRRTQNTHLAHTLSHLADKYGPIFTLRIGMQRAVVVSSREAVMESFTTNDKSFADRPKSCAGTYLGYENAAFGFSSGPYWREMRKLVMSEVLSPRRLEAMRDLRVAEIELSIRELYLETKRESSETSSRVVISRWIEKVALNIIVKTIAGKRYSDSKRGDGGRNEEWFRKLFAELTLVMGQFVVSDAIPIPFLRWMDFQGNIKEMKRVSKVLDSVIEEWIDEHVEKKKGPASDQVQDFIDVLLSSIDDNFKNFGRPKLTIIKANVVNVVLGGFDTISVYLTWLLALLVKHQNVMKRVQEEIDKKTGNQRWVQESDIKNLPYLLAVIKETLRLYPPLPLSVHHEAVEDCQLGGYLIPKGTQLFVNILKLHRDPRFWPNPDEFRPERFLRSHVNIDVAGQQFEFIPFGSGRRSCPGTSFAMQVTNVIIARLIQGFDFGSAGEIDMSEGLGITMPRANPLEVFITPRLHSSLYE